MQPRLQAADSAPSSLGVANVLGDPESWDGPHGCHVQEGDIFQWNDGGEYNVSSSPGHTPICLDTSSGIEFRTTLASPSEDHGLYGLGCFLNQGGWSSEQGVYYVTGSEAGAVPRDDHHYICSSPTG